LPIQRFRRDFEDLGPIGSGGFAEVRRVRSRVDGRVFAAKIVTLRPGRDEDEAQEQLYKALAEPRILAQLHHPQILKYHGCWIELETFSAEERAERMAE
jgi:serine/threonine protein kinase